jgi:hypothetical protein
MDLETKAVEKPVDTVVTREDVLMMQLANERVRRTAAEAGLAQQRHQTAMVELKQFQVEMERRYGLGPEDVVEIETGKIVRKSKKE